VQKGIEPWQVDQARKVLIFLYREFFTLNLRVPEATAKTKGKVSELIGLKGGRSSWMMGRGEWDVHLQISNCYPLKEGLISGRGL